MADHPKTVGSDRCRARPLSTHERLCGHGLLQSRSCGVIPMRRRDLERKQAPWTFKAQTVAFRLDDPVPARGESVSNTCTIERLVANTQEVLGSFYSDMFNYGSRIDHRCNNLTYVDFVKDLTAG